VIQTLESKVSHEELKKDDAIMDEKIKGLKGEIEEMKQILDAI